MSSLNELLDPPQVLIIKEENLVTMVMATKVTFKLHSYELRLVAYSYIVTVDYVWSTM